MNQRPVNKILIKKKDGKIKSLNFDLDEKKTNQHGQDVSGQVADAVVQGNQNMSLQKDDVNQSRDQDKENSSTQQTPDFYFHIEDEEEVKQYFDQGRSNLRNKKRQLINIYLQEILLYFDILLKDLSGDQEKKIKRILESYLRGVRSFLDVKLVLIEEGPVGFSLPENDVYQILKKAEEKKKELDEIDHVGMDQKIKKHEQEKVEVEAKEVSAEIKAKIVDLPHLNGHKKGLDKEVSRPESLPTLENMDEKENEKEPEAPELKQEDIKNNKVDDKKVVESKKELDLPQQDNNHQKTVNTTEIKKPMMVAGGSEKKDNNIDSIVNKRTKGPLEELEEINIDEFRKGGDNAKARVNKIYEKIKLLEKQSTAKKMAGVASWKKSSVYKEYLNIGEKSILDGKKIEEIILEKNTLSMEEFNAIADLNNQISY